MTPARRRLVWFGLAAVVLIPLLAAAQSPLLAWRSPVYIAACFAGIVALGAILMQPLLVAGYLPGLRGPAGRRAHRKAGLVLVASIIIHVSGLWITSPPDMIDALFFVSPTPFSAWGVIAMWALLAAALLAGLSRRFRLPPQGWRLTHTLLAAAAVLASVWHALLIEGIMETISKTMLCLLVFASAATAIIDLRTRRWRLAKPR